MRRQAGDDDVGAEAIGFTIEQEILASATEVGEEEDFYTVQFSLADECAVVGLGRFIFFGWMENPPRSGFVAAMKGRDVVGLALQVSEEAAVGDRTKSERAGEASEPEGRGTGCAE